MGKRTWQFLVALLLVATIKGLGVAPQALTRYEPAANEAAVARVNKRLDDARGLLKPLLNNNNQTFRKHVQAALESLPAPEVIKDDKPKAIEQLALASSSLNSAAGTVNQQPIINPVEKAALILHEVKDLLLADLTGLPSPSASLPSSPATPLAKTATMNPPSYYEEAILLGLLVVGLITLLNSIFLFKFRRTVAGLKENMPAPPESSAPASDSGANTQKQSPTASPNAQSGATHLTEPLDTNSSEAAPVEGGGHIKCSECWTKRLVAQCLASKL